jgi:hypothetical protein
MKRVGLGVALAACAAVEAAEPVAIATAQAASTPASVPASPPASAPASAVANPKPAIRKPLDLRIGDVRKYMMPDEFRAALDAPDAEKNTVVVEARRELLPVEYEKPIPTWPLGPLWWALKSPTQSWRILLPDINAPEDGPTVDKVPPPIFRWGP